MVLTILGLIVVILLISAPIISFFVCQRFIKKTWISLLISILVLIFEVWIVMKNFSIGGY